MAGETLYIYRSISEVILKIHLIHDEKIKVKIYANQEKSVSRVQSFFTPTISFVFSSRVSQQLVTNFLQQTRNNQYEHDLPTACEQICNNFFAACNSLCAVLRL